MDYRRDRSKTAVAGGVLGDAIVHTGWDVMPSRIKIRKAGFFEHEDTEDMIVRQIRDLRERKFVT